VAEECSDPSRRLNFIAPPRSPVNQPRRDERPGNREASNDVIEFVIYLSVAMAYIALAFHRGGLF
jgi:hypothetical protein